MFEMNQKWHSRMANSFIDTHSGFSLLKCSVAGEMAFCEKNTQNVFPLYSVSFVYLLSIKFTFITITYL